MVQGPGFRVQGSGFMVQFYGSVCSVQVLGFTVVVPGSVFGVYDELFHGSWLMGHVV
jgi:hypothetical protein